jgi:glycosyltransferase involved in cell wall biosynthesis
MTRFSVLIPVYNGAEFLGEALQSVADQSLSEVKVIVSNNASTDGTALVLQEWQGRLDLTVITQPKTLPMQQHFNAILGAVDTEIYMLLCHDDYLADRDALRQAQAALIENPDVSAVYCDLVYVSASRRKLATRSFRRSGRFDVESTGKATLRTARNLFGIPLGLRRAALGDLRYDLDLPYTMDVDLSWAISRHEQAFHIPRPMIANRYQSGNATWSLISKAESEYLKLAEKYAVTLDRGDRIRLKATIFFVNLQKRVFSLYGSLLSWLD